jgi:hypothetical protein
MRSPALFFVPRSAEERCALRANGFMEGRSRYSLHYPCRTASLPQGHPGLLHLTMRSDNEPRRMGLASANMAASWRREAGGDGRFIFPSYCIIIRKLNRKISLFYRIPFR